LLSGPSSAGKTTLAAALQDALPGPWVIAPADALCAGFPSHRLEFVALEWDHRLREACVRAAVGLIGAGLNVILEQGLWDPWGQAMAARLLGPARFFVVGVVCELGVAESREAARFGHVTGLARRQREEVLASGMPGDLIVDSTRGGPAELAARIAQWLAEDPLPAALGSIAGNRQPEPACRSDREGGSW
jgi:chloramphenicol 3-O phosphotransferase